MSSNWTVFAADELRTNVVGHAVRFFPSIGSTNDLLKDAARTGTAEGTVYVADEQTAGRGRRGRSWHAPAGSSLLISTLFRPTWLPAGDAFLLTIIAAVAVAEAIEDVTHLSIDLKWPNDVYVRGRKLGGLLVESEISDTRLHWAIIGCGINVNWDPAAIPDLTNNATSISAELGAPFERRQLLRALLLRLDQRYTHLRQGARSALFETWRRRLVTLGQAVRADTPHGALYGLATDVTPDGALLILDQTGVQHTVAAGDVSIRAYE